jgi:hypothetical protein
LPSADITVGRIIDRERTSAAAVSYVATGLRKKMASFGRFDGNPVDQTVAVVYFRSLMRRDSASSAVEIAYRTTAVIEGKDPRAIGFIVEMSSAASISASNCRDNSTNGDRERQQTQISDSHRNSPLSMNP